MPHLLLKVFLLRQFCQLIDLCCLAILMSVKSLIFKYHIYIHKKREKKINTWSSHSCHIFMINCCLTKYLVICHYNVMLHVWWDPWSYYAREGRTEWWKMSVIEMLEERKTGLLAWKVLKLETWNLSLHLSLLSLEEYIRKSWLANHMIISKHMKEYASDQSWILVADLS